MLFGTRSEKLRREVELAEALLKQREQDSDRYSGREDDPQVPRQLRQSRHRRPLPAHLPREIHRTEPLPPDNPAHRHTPGNSFLLDHFQGTAHQFQLFSAPHRTGKKACNTRDCIVEARDTTLYRAGRRRASTIQSPRVQQDTANICHCIVRVKSLHGPPGCRTEPGLTLQLG
ncbi:hypothetical protein EIMP300_56680 [Escherichia coli]|uniref:Transposase TnpC homeodomain domain-containing protein n=1 Tax=Escherichia coli TaxID=562 RepID=A0A8S0FW82_ECOLX|nr:hypothetical protein EIMP300_56680 [Escherichia coli]